MDLRVAGSDTISVVRTPHPDTELVDPRHLRALAHQMDHMEASFVRRSPAAALMREAAEVMARSAEELKALRRRLKQLEALHEG